MGGIDPVGDVDLVGAGVELVGGVDGGVVFL